MLVSGYEARPLAPAPAPFVLLCDGSLTERIKLFATGAQAAEGLYEAQRDLPLHQWQVIPYPAWLVLLASGARSLRDDSCWDLN